jgi:tripartite-type tricarboxylate transporter receptor subunit TctC
MVCLGQPASALPGVPILDAAGLKGFGVYAWYGVFAPVATPQPVVARLYRELKDAFAHPRVQTVLAKRGLESAWADLARLASAAPAWPQSMTILSRLTT